MTPILQKSWAKEITSLMASVHELAEEYALWKNVHSIGKFYYSLKYGDVYLRDAPLFTVKAPYDDYLGVVEKIRNKKKKEPWHDLLIEALIAMDRHKHHPGSASGIPVAFVQFNINRQGVFRMYDPEAEKVYGWSTPCIFVEMDEWHEEIQRHFKSMGRHADYQKMELRIIGLMIAAFIIALIIFMVKKD